MNMTMNNMFSHFKSPKIFFMPLTIMSLIPLVIFFTSMPSRLPHNSPFLIIMDLYYTFFGLRKYNMISTSDIIFSAFIMMMSTNILCQITYSFSVTKHMCFTLGLSVPIWVWMNISGFILNWYKKVSKFLPSGTPTLLIPLMIMIEVLSLLMQPITLSIRLMLNVTAGHMMIFLITTGVEFLLSYYFYFSPLTLVILTVFMLLELVVAIIQGLVYLLLMANYYNDNF